MKTKVCKGPCGQEKPLSDFHKQSKAKDGVKTFLVCMSLGTFKSYPPM